MGDETVGNDDWLATEFEANRARLVAVAYRMLGSHAEAEEAVQEAWLRLGGTDRDAVENLGGWLTTVTARLCLDRLRARRARPEDPTDTVDIERTLEPDANDPAQQALLADSVGAALLVVLDRLAPAERVAFVLHDVFAVPFDEIAPIVDRSPEAARQLASRARRRVQGTPPTDAVDLVEQRTIVDAFLRAAQGGDFDTLVALLDPDVVLRPDATAVRMGSLRETHGASAVASALSGGAKAAKLALVDGIAGLVWAPAGRTRGAIEFTVVDSKIVAINVTGDAERIAQLEIVTLES
jgi:RNA polymerase sigma factor (sigma-70 family)